jgi:hypothetical protein
MSFWLSFHLPLLGPTGAYWLDDPPDLSCQDSTRQHPVDGSRLSCKQQVGGSSPPASSHKRRSQPCKRTGAGQHRSRKDRRQDWRSERHQRPGSERPGAASATTSTTSSTSSADRRRTAPTAIGPAPPSATT